MTLLRPRTSTRRVQVTVVIVALLGSVATGPGCSGADDPPLSGASTETLVWAARGIVDEFAPALDVDDSLSSGPATRHAVRQAAADDRWVDLLDGLDRDGAEALEMVSPIDGSTIPAFGGELSAAAFTRRLRAELTDFFVAWVGAPEVRSELGERELSESDSSLVIEVIAEVLAEDWLDLFRLDLVDVLPVSGSRIKIDGQLLADAATVFWADEAGPVFEAYQRPDGVLADFPVVLATISARADDRFSQALSGALATTDRREQEAALRAAVPAGVDVDLPAVDDALARIAAGEDGDIEVNDSDVTVGEQVALLVADLFDDTSRARLEAVVNGMTSAYATAYQLTLLEHAA